jgi:hypothetical protein
MTVTIHAVYINSFPVMIRTQNKQRAHKYVICPHKGAVVCPFGAAKSKGQQNGYFKLRNLIFCAQQILSL